MGNLTDYHQYYLMTFKEILSPNEPALGLVSELSLIQRIINTRNFPWDEFEETRHVNISSRAEII